MTPTGSGNTAQVGCLERFDVHHPKSEDLPGSITTQELQTHQPTRTRADRHDEARLYRWQLTQRLLADVNALHPDRRAYLDKHLPGWNYAVTDEDLDHAVSVIDTGLNEAVTIWFNLKGLRSTPLTLEEIRALVESESW